LTSIVIDSAVTGWTAAELSAALLADNIESRPLWKPMHLQPVFADAPAVTNGTSQALFETGLTLPSGSALTPVEVDRIFAVFGQFLGSAT
jgi:dTDP-4-amino-4,6-dideoxygalactose transaminase